MLEKTGMAMVNPLVNLANVKDSQWLTLEVCREFQRNKCSRTDQECRYAHPPPHVEVQNGRVTACFDSIKGKCQRKDPPCKYLHPPQHLKEILLQNGKNNLYWKNRLQAMAQSQTYPYVPTPGIIPTMVPSYLYQQQVDPLPHSTSIVPAALKIDRAKEVAERSHKVIQVPRSAVGPAAPKPVPYPAIMQGQYPVMQHPYMQSIHAASGIPFNPYFSGIPIPTTMSMGLPGSASDGSLMAQQAVPGMMPIPMAAAAGAVHQQKAIRPDRLEVCREFQRGSCSRQPSECRYAHPPETVTVDASDNHVTVCMDHIKGKCSRDACRYFHPPPHLQAQIKATQQRACNSSGTSAMHSQALPQMVEVLTGKKRPRDPADDFVLTSMAGLSPYAKRLAVTDNKGGMPMYQPSMAAYQQALAVQPYLQAAPSFVQTTGADSTMPAYTSLASARLGMAHPVATMSSAASFANGFNYPVPVTVAAHAAASSPMFAMRYAAAAAAMGQSMVTTNPHVPAAAAAVTMEAISGVHPSRAETNQSPVTIPVCRDFRAGLCQRPTCKFAHINEDQVDVSEGKVMLCPDAAAGGTCQRASCKHYHPSA